MRGFVDERELPFKFFIFFWIIQKVNKVPPFLFSWQRSLQVILNMAKVISHLFLFSNKLTFMILNFKRIFYPCTFYFQLEILAGCNVVQICTPVSLFFAFSILFLYLLQLGYLLAILGNYVPLKCFNHRLLKAVVMAHATIAATPTKRHSLAYYQLRLGQGK